MESDLSSAVTVETLPVITYQGIRVLTTDILAQVYGAAPINIQQNYANNKDRFESEKHFFLLVGDDLREFKQLHRLDKKGSVEISPRVKALTLWTERGAARHAKMLVTDQAWDVFEKLEDAYFRPPVAINPRPAPEFTLGSDKLFPSEQQTLSEIVHSKAAHLPAETQGKALAEIWSRIHNKFRVSKYSDLQRERLAEAIIYVNQMELRGVKSPAPQPALPMPPASSSGRWLVARDRSGEWSLFEIPKEAFVLKAEEWPGVIRTNDFPEELLKKVLVAVSERMK
jgi:hypothetical protein